MWRRGLINFNILKNSINRQAVGKIGINTNTVLTSRINFNSNFVETNNRLYNTKSEKSLEAEIEDGEDEYYVDVSNLENRWTLLNFETQQDIISYLNVKQEFGWNYLTIEEKRAIYFIAYGNWGPRDQKIMSSAEFIFKLMTNMLLFSVLGFSIMNYAIDQETIEKLTENSTEESKESKEEK